ncbi:nucleotide-diphospho-sugar transferase [Dipodascopsis tothii]|uniref:nucleotide-diphospho-sugar transferase n=1 Tax=Dipodascopsis tothii TaxID=44089 RepID=UPI0034CF3046
MARKSPIVPALAVVMFLYVIYYCSSTPSAAVASGVMLSTALLKADPKGYQQLVRQRLEHQFQYDLSDKMQQQFPKVIWQTWKYLPSDKRFSTRFRTTEASWTKENEAAGYVHEVVDDETAGVLVDQLFMSVPEVVEAYHSMPAAILRADFFRYLILLARGGVYSDIDTMALKAVTEWIPSGLSSVEDRDGKPVIPDDAEGLQPSARAANEHAAGLVVGVEADPDRPDWHDWYARRLQFCQWTIQAKRGHPVMAEIVADITRQTLERKMQGRLELPKTKDSGSQIMDWTGPGVWTDTVFKYLAKFNISWKNITNLKKGVKIGDVVVLPITSFSPGVGTMGAQSVDHPHAFVQHIFEGSWKPARERKIGGG